MQHAVAMQWLKKSVQVINRKTTVAADRHDTKDITNYLIWLHCRGHTISEVAGLGMGPFHALPHSEQRGGGNGGRHQMHKLDDPTAHVR